MTQQSTIGSFYTPSRGTRHTRQETSTLPAPKLPISKLPAYSYLDPVLGATKGCRFGAEEDIDEGIQRILADAFVKVRIPTWKSSTLTETRTKSVSKVDDA